MKTWIPHDRQFAYLTWQEVDLLPRESTLLVLPTAAIEQHGYHLPLATDTLINNLVLGHALQLLPLEASVFALPPICYGKSNEHIGCAGTLAVSAATFMAVARDICSSLANAGFQRIVFYNTHGGNISAIDIMARDLRAEFGLRTFCLSASAGQLNRARAPRKSVWISRRRTGDFSVARRLPGASQDGSIFGELYRRPLSTGSVTTRERPCHFCLAHQRYRSVRCFR